MNGILKSEWIDEVCFKSFQAAKERIDEIVILYNSLKPHASYDWLTPLEAELRTGKLKHHWSRKTVVRKSDRRIGAANTRVKNLEHQDSRPCKMGCAVVTMVLSILSDMKISVRQCKTGIPAIFIRFSLSLNANARFFSIYITLVNREEKYAIFYQYFFHTSLSL